MADETKNEAEQAAAAKKAEGKGSGVDLKELVSAFATAQREAMKPVAATRTEGLDRAQRPGGVYLVNGQYVDCNGRPVPESHLPEDPGSDPLYVRYHPRVSEDADDRPGIDQFGNRVSGTDEEVNERPTPRSRRV